MLYFLCSLSGLVLFYLLAQKKRQNLPYLISFYSIICMVYLLWRFTAIPRGPFSAFFFGSALFFAEILTILRFGFLQFLFSKPHCLVKKTLQDFPDGPPALDVFICTYNESISILEKTVIGALNLNYPKTLLHVYVLDDGNRPAVKALCQATGICYGARKTQAGAKAGNLNYGLSISSSPLFCVLDADMVPTKEFLSRTVGYFSDPLVAFVQTPQVFYNRDMYQRNLKKEDIPNEQDFFMRDIEAGRDTLGAVLHVGTNAVFRRSYVEEIGGYPTDSITEDMAVGIKLQAKGYRSIFVNEMLVFGLSAATYADLAVQRDRWCRGNIQVIKKLRPLRNNGLSLPQKLCYVDGTLYWFSCFQKLIYMLCPLFFLLTGQRTIHAPFLTILIVFLPYFIGLLFLYHITVPDTRSLKWAHIYDIAMAPQMCFSVIREFFFPNTHFAVTPKENRSDKSYFQFHVIFPHLCFIFVSLFCFYIGFLHLQYSTISISAFLINLFWSAYNLFAALICVRVAYHIGHLPHTYDALILGGQAAAFVFDTETYTGKILSVWEGGLSALLDSQTLPKVSGTLHVMFHYEGQAVDIPCYVNSQASCKLTLFYQSLTLAQKQAVLGIYMDHLRPVFAINRKQK